MTYKVELHGNDGTFLVGGNPLHTTFECDDNFIDGCIGRSGGDITDIEWIMEEAAKDINSALYLDIDYDDEGAQERGYADADALWKAQHDDNGVYLYEDDEYGFRIAIDSFWGMQDTLALTTGQVIIPHLREAFERALAA